VEIKKNKANKAKTKLNEKVTRKKKGEGKY